MKTSRLFVGGYMLTVLAFGIYSFALMDPNLTLIKGPLWESFRNTMVNFGYLNRPDSWVTYLVLVLLLTGFHIQFIRKDYSIRPLHLALGVGALLLFSYPLLSHDFFNYIFDAKIFTAYGKNPYHNIPADFPQDEWLRFMQWTHRTYPYGPTFLPITIIASFMGMGKFILNYLIFKGLFVGTYVGSVWILEKMNKKWALFFASSPLILIEGVVNAHNDLLAVFFALAGIYLLSKTDMPTWKSTLLLLVSGGIKYFSLPTIFLSAPGTKKHPAFVSGVFLSILVLILYISFTGALQPWYFLNLIIFIPYYFEHIKSLQIFYFGLLVSYYPIIRFGKWEPDPGFNIKNAIVFVFLGINVMWILYMRNFGKSPLHK